MSKKQEERKRQIFETAKVLFSRFGFRKTAVDEIAEAAGISKRTLYKRFRSKEELLSELVMYEALKLRRYCMDEIKKLDDPLDKLETLCVLTNNYFDDNVFLGRVMSDDDQLFSPFLGDRVHQVEEGIRGILINLLREGVGRGTFRQMDVDAAAETILVLQRTFAYRHGGVEPGNSEWVGLILHGIKAD